MPKAYSKSNNSKTAVRKNKKMRKPKSTKAKADAAYKGLIKLRNQREIKYKDFTLQNAYAFYNPTFTSIVSTLSQGTGDTNRIGDKVYIKNVKIQGMIQNNGTSKQIARLVVLYVKGDPANLTDWDDIYGGAVSTGAPLAFKRWDNRFQTITLLDKMVTLGSGLQSVTINASLDVGKFISFNAGSTNRELGDILYAVCSQDTGPSNGPQYWLQFRTIYSDT